MGKLKIEARNRNIHDIEYDIFRSLEHPAKSVPKADANRWRQLAVEVGIPEFRRNVGQLARRTGREVIPKGELKNAIKELQKEASRILADLTKLAGGDPKGVEFLQSFLH